MERLYRALVWLAGAAVVVSLVASYIVASSIYSNFTSGGGSTEVSGSSGSATVLLTVLSGQVKFIAMDLVSLLSGGAVILAMALAWAARRREWLAALIIVTLATLVLPSAITTWLILNPSAPSQSQGEQFPVVVTLLMLNLQLIPVSLALVFGLIRSRPAADTTDAALGIERSAL